MLNNLTFNGITIRTRVTATGRIQYFAPDMANACDKRWGNYYQLESTKEFVRQLTEDNEAGIPASLYIEEINTGAQNQRGTWIDEDLALHFAQWLSPKFAYQVILWTKTLLREGFVSIKEDTSKLQLAKVELETVQKELDKTAIETFKFMLAQAKADGDERMAHFYQTALAQYSRAKLLNGMVDSNILPEQQFEGVVDVAIRLGIRVPANLEGSLGKYVKKHAGELLTQVAVDSAGDATYRTDKRFSQASNKVVYANMYPYKHPKVESLVRQYLESKGVI